MKPDLLGNLLNQTVLHLGGLELSIYRIGVSILVLSLVSVAVFAVLVLLNLDSIAYHNEQRRKLRQESASSNRQKAYKAHMKRVRRYEAHLREERGY